jgi:DNA-binding response OmpR family regulator
MKEMQRAMKETQVLPTRESASTPVRSHPSPPHRILVVEDDIYIRQLSTESLSLCGYHVDAAEDGAVAWDALQLNRYDLVVTDNNMPKVSGVELIKKLHAAHMALPVIMATGILPEEEFTRYPWLQPAASLVKPYTIAELLGTVREVLRATDGPREQIASRPNWQSQPSVDGLQL